MKKIERKYLILLVIGEILLSMNIFTKNLMTINSDIMDFTTGMGAGIMFLTVIFVSRKQLMPK